MVSEIRDIIVSVIFFTLILVGGLALVSELRSTELADAQQRGLGIPASSSFDADTDKFNDTFNRYTDVVSSVDSLKESVSTTSTGFFGYTGGAIEALFGGAYNTLGLIFTSFSFVTSTDENSPGILYGLTTAYGVPSWFPILIVGIIIVIISFAILKAVFQVG